MAHRILAQNLAPMVWYSQGAVQVVCMFSFATRVSVFVCFSSKYLLKNLHLFWNTNKIFIQLCKNEVCQNTSFQVEKSDFINSYLKKHINSIIKACTPVFTSDKHSISKINGFMDLL